MEIEEGYIVADIDGAGRGLIAARDFRAGDLILKATPAGLGGFDSIHLFQLD